MSVPFCNNLKKDDRVVHAPTNRPGVVAMGPRETSRYVQVRMQGNSCPTRIDVIELRLVYENLGKMEVEKVPPIDGEPPADERIRAPRPPMVTAQDAADDPAVFLRQRRELLREKIKERESANQRDLEAIERLNAAIQTLDPAPSLKPAFGT